MTYSVKVKWSLFEALARDVNQLTSVGNGSYVRAVTWQIQFGQLRAIFQTFEAFVPAVAELFPRNDH